MKLRTPVFMLQGEKEPVMIVDLTRLAERRMLAAVAKGKLSHLSGEGRPLPAHPETAFVDPLEAVGFQIMHEAGFVPKELELTRALGEARAALRAATDPAEHRRLMARVADLETRRNIAREARLHLLHAD